jgi:hypothetical protein
MSERTDGERAALGESGSAKGERMNIVAALIALLVVLSALATVAVTVFDVRPFAHEPARAHARGPRRSRQ